jgi:DNA-binding transcriptional regulator YiaG
MTNTKKPASRSVAKKAPKVGQRIIQGLEEALAWSKGEDVPVRVTHVQAPDIDVSKVRRRMGLSQTQFALKFGFPPATLELGRGTGASGYADPCAFGRNRKAPGGRRRRAEGPSMTDAGYGPYCGYPEEICS